MTSHRTATDRLTGALVALAADGERPRCSDHGTSHLWTSDDVDERATAAAWCSGCPVIDACGAAALENDERHHVWAGVDRSKIRTRKAAV